MNHEISAEWLTIEKVEEILNSHASLSLSDDAKERIEKCRKYLDEKMESQTEPIYGITTGLVRCATYLSTARHCRSFRKILSCRMPAGLANVWLRR